MNRIILAALALLVSATITRAQLLADPSINIVAAPISIPQNTSGTVEITALNEGSANIAPSTLEITVTAGPNAEITGLDASNTDATWTVNSLTTGNGNLMRLRNTGSGIAVADGGVVVLSIAGRVVSPTGEIRAKITYLPGTLSTPGNPSFSSQGNGSPFNDSSATQLQVTNPAPLPVQLTSFTGQAKGCDALLAWKAAGERDIDRYELEGSADGKQFVFLQTVKATGAGSYSADHAQPAGRYHYRLRTVPLYGGALLSKTIAVVTGCNGSEVKVYPNPAKDDLSISGISAGATLSLYNAMGQLVAGRQATAAAAQLSIGQLPAGAYRLVVVDGDGATRSFAVHKAE